MLRYSLGLIASAVCTLGFASPAHAVGSFDDEVKFVGQHMPTVVLTDAKGDARVMVAPKLQGRVLSSTVGADAPSFGWINHELIESDKLRPHINAFGGEDRFWIGPEGGQFSVFFKKGDAFDLEHWQTPAPIDTEAYDVVSQAADHVTFRKQFQLTNYTGTQFDIRVDRQVRLLSPDDAWKALKLDPAAGVKLVAFESNNKITNAGGATWSKETGLLSIWILGMMNASPDATVLVPYKQGPESDLGKACESSYFGEVPPNRLHVKDGVIYFRADAHYRSKIGVNPRRAMPVLGSYDSGRKVLTLVQHSLPAGQTDYVNSLWKIQDAPFAGDAVNSYNDGPNALGQSLGNFYEVESSSPAEALAPNESAEHVQRTMHLSGDEAALDHIAQSVLGVKLADVATALPPLSK